MCTHTHTHARMQIYEQLETEFAVTLAKPQKKIIKSLVIDVVEEQNNA